MINDLNFISRSDMKEHVKKTILEYGEILKTINLKKFNKNIIDPIKLTFDSKLYKKSLEEIIDDEIFRQRDKSSNNSIGYFHQNIFKYIKNCEVPKKGWDIIFTKEDKSKVYVEMKNKHNTMNSSSSNNTYIKMQDQLLKDYTCECALVEIIAKKSQNINWEKTIKNEKYKNERIKRMSVDQFYFIVTGDKLAFKKIYDNIPYLIDEIIEEDDKFVIEKDTVLEELRKSNPNLFKALYKLGFSTYYGF